MRECDCGKIYLCNPNSNRMKKSIRILLYGMVLLLCGCGNRQQPTPADRYSVDTLKRLASINLEMAYQRVGEGEQNGELSAYEAALLFANLTYQFTDDYRLAMDYCRKALDALDGEKDDEQRLSLLYMLGNLAETVKDFNTCIKTCAEGKTIAHRHKMRFEESSFDYVAGKCMFDLGLDDEGLSLMKASIDKMKPIVKTDSDYGHLIFFVNNLIICYLADEAMQQALAETETLEQLIDGMEKKYPEAKSYCESYRYHVYAERAVAKVILGRSDEAQADFDQALTYDFSNTHVGMLFQNDYYAATGNVDSLLSVMARIPYRDTDTVQRLYRKRLSYLAQAYRVAGDTAMANHYQHRIDTLSQLIERLEQQEGIAVNAAQYDTQVHRLALEDLTKNTKKMYVFLVSLVVVMALAFSVAYLANKRRQKKVAQEIRRKSKSMEEEMTRLQKQVRIIARDSSQSPSATSQQASKSLATLIEGQQLYLKKDISRALMAQMLGCSHQTLTKMLNEIQPGISFPDYIKGLRIAHALKLIKENPSLTVQQVADQSGFYSISSFERSFKAVTGKTPREYLRK